LETSTLDIMFWAALALVVARVGRTGDCRYSLLGGLVLGVELANKHSIGFFTVAIFLGALVSGGSRLVLNRWAAAGVAIAAWHEQTPAVVSRKPRTVTIPALARHRDHSSDPIIATVGPERTGHRRDTRTTRRRPPRQSGP
jgi:hypothetical protein